MGKHYVITYWSQWGMGSDTEEALISEDNLRELILLETARYREGDQFADERFSGTCEGEAFCDSEDPEEQIADVINKRLNSSTTYSHHNDLIEIPPTTKINVTKKRFGNTVVRLCNQFLCGRDVIFGEGDFTLYDVRFDKDFLIDNELHYYESEDDCHRFADYSLKNVAEYHMGGLSDIDFVLSSNKDKLARLSAELEGIKIKHKGAYISDLAPEMVNDEYLEKGIAEARSTIAKFENLPQVSDEYYSFMYDPKYIRSSYLRKIIRKLANNDKGKDHTRYVFNYPISLNEFGTVYTIKHDTSRKLTYSELFKKGYDMKYLMAVHSNSAKTEEGLGEPDLTAVLASAFAYD